MPIAVNDLLPFIVPLLKLVILNFYMFQAKISIGYIHAKDTADDLSANFGGFKTGAGIVIRF